MKKIIDLCQDSQDTQYLVTNQVEEKSPKRNRDKKIDEGLFIEGNSKKRRKIIQNQSELFSSQSPNEFFPIFQNNIIQNNTPSKFNHGQRNLIGNGFQQYMMNSNLVNQIQRNLNGQSSMIRPTPTRNNNKNATILPNSVMVFSNMFPINQVPKTLFRNQKPENLRGNLLNQNIPIRQTTQPIAQPTTQIPIRRTRTLSSPEMNHQDLKGEHKKILSDSWIMKHYKYQKELGLEIEHGQLKTF